MLKKTTVVNAASHDYEGASGKLALIELEQDDDAKVQWRKIDDGLGLYGVGYVKAANFKAAGIHKVQQIIELTPDELALRIGCNLRTAHSYHLRARSVVENRVVVLGPLMQLDDNPIFLDIETDLAQRLVWLIGVYFPKQDRFVQYLAENSGNEMRMLERFLSDMRGIRGTIYTFSGTRFDERVLKRRIEANSLDHSKLPQFVDICTAIRHSVIFPVQSYRLKDLARYFGYKYRHPNLDGMSVAMEFMITYQKTKNKKLLKKLLEYNEDDVKSLPAIITKIREVTGAAMLSITHKTETTIDVQVRIPDDRMSQLAMVRKHFGMCGAFYDKSNGRTSCELRFRTKDPMALAEIKGAMAKLGFREGSFQEWNGRGYLPYYGEELLRLIKEL
jgi:uncharacterized protein YprB with RNaseH-like and TPR domain